RQPGGRRAVRLDPQGRRHGPVGAGLQRLDLLALQVRQGAGPPRRPAGQGAGADPELGLDRIPALRPPSPPNRRLGEEHVGTPPMNPRVFVLILVTFAFGSGAFIFAGLLETMAADLKVSTAVAGQLQTAFV